MTAPVDALPPEAIDAFLDDTCDLIFHVIREPDYPWTHTKRELAVCIERRECPSPAVLIRIVEWTLFVIPWNAKQRDLTSDEQRIYAAACRLSDAIARAEHAAR